jgi:hypothetical protein
VDAKRRAPTSSLGVIQEMSSLNLASDVVRTNFVGVELEAMFRGDLNKPWKTGCKLLGKTYKEKGPQKILG